MIDTPRSASSGFLPRHIPFGNGKSSPLFRLRARSVFPHTGFSEFPGKQIAPGFCMETFPNRGSQTRLLLQYGAIPDLVHMMLAVTTASQYVFCVRPSKNVPHHVTPSVCSFNSPPSDDFATLLFVAVNAQIFFPNSRVFSPY